MPMEPNYVTLPSHVYLLWMTNPSCEGLVTSPENS